MLCKLFTGSDYLRTLKHRRLISGAITLVGLVGLVCYFLLMDGSSFSDHARGFYCGAAVGLTAAGIILLFRTQYLLTHPDAQHRAKIKETDERERAIALDAALFAGLFTFFAGLVALFVVVLFDRTAALLLLGMLYLYAVVFVAASACLSKTR